MSQLDHESDDQSAAANALVRKFGPRGLISESGERWRIGSKIPINVYAGDRPVCQCHTTDDANLIVLAVNALLESRERFK
jgi:hypothetical protein